MNEACYIGMRPILQQCGIYVGMGPVMQQLGMSEYYVGMRPVMLHVACMSHEACHIAMRHVIYE